MFELPLAKTGKKGRPKVRDEKLTLKDFALSPIEDTEYSVGSRKVMTKIFGKHPVYSVVTSTKSGSERLFICTKSPDKLHFDFSSDLGKASLFAKSDISFLPLTVCSLRWHIETAYYEQKKFWSLGFLYASQQNWY